MTACCQITCAIPWLTCEQLPYPPEHPHISRMRQRDKSDLPLPVLSYKYFFLRYTFSILSFYSLKSTFLVAALHENSKNSSKGLLHQSSKSSIFPLLWEEMAINFIVPEVSPPSFFYTFTVLLFICKSIYWVPFSSFLFLCFLLFLHFPNPLGVGR